MRCWIILNMNEDEARKYIYRAIKKLPNQSKNIIPIKNGQSIVVELNNNKTEFYAAGTAAIGSDKVFYSNKVIIGEDCVDKAYVLKLFLRRYNVQVIGDILELTEV